MGTAQIVLLALGLSKELIVAYMEMMGKTSISIEDLKTKSPKDLLKEMGIDE